MHYKSKIEYNSNCNGNKLQKPAYPKFQISILPEHYSEQFIKFQDFKNRTAKGRHEFQDNFISFDAKKVDEAKPANHMADISYSL